LPAGNASGTGVLRSSVHARLTAIAHLAQGCAYGQVVTISDDDALRDRIREHLAGHDRRVVTDPTKRHAAVAVVLVDSIVGEDRVDPAPLDDWIDGEELLEELLEPGLDGRMVDVSGGAAFLLCRRASRLSSHA